LLRHVASVLLLLRRWHRGVSMGAATAAIAVAGRINQQRRQPLYSFPSLSALIGAQQTAILFYDAGLNFLH